MTQAIAPALNRPAIDEIPTRPSTQKALVVGLAAAMLAPLALAFWRFGPRALSAFFASHADVQIALQHQHLLKPIAMVFPAFLIVGLIGGGLGVLSLSRLGVFYHALRAGLMLVYPAVLGYAVLVWVAVFALLDAGVEVGGAMDRAVVIKWWWGLSWPALAVGLYVFWLHVMLQSRSVYAAYTRRQGPAMRGDRVLEDWRTHGRDPRARRSFYTSFATHFVILILIPFLLQERGCVEAYRVPKGSGEPAVTQVQVVKQQKKKKKKLTLRADSAIIFDVPDLDDAEVDKLMEQMTQARYEASVNAKAGKLGSGGGKQGGWPEGMEDYKIRFIRLDHGGKGWDDGMDNSDADINFLRAFAQATGFTKIANKGESHAIALLDKYPDDGFPPFVYLTGNGSMGNVSARDRKILREYCLKGGMLIADAGSRDFHNSFVRFIQQVFPDKPLLDIADDDMLYQLPYGFPNGAPAFWGHGGRRAMGIKHDGRWIVFYHPGDMNDAWKSPGYSDVTPEMRDAAMHLGINLVYYAFTQWNDAITEQRK